MKSVVQYNLPVMLLREGDYFVAYTPVLDLSVQARSKHLVRKRFEEAVLLFFEELEEMGTTDEVLAELGWVKQRRDAQWKPPKLVDSIEEIRVPVPA